MASDVDICNMALSHLGETANVSSIDPPEGSAQAEHCQTFYPIARDTLLEMHAWSFATRRATLAEVTNTSSSWLHAYAQPSDALKLIAILPADAPDDLSSGLEIDTDAAAGAYYPRAFITETNAAGSEIIYTNEPSAVLRYTRFITDPTKFSPLFQLTLSWHLASLLAGPILKGDVGAAEAKRCMQIAEKLVSQATVSDANDRMTRVAHSVPWLAGR